MVTQNFTFYKYLIKIGDILHYQCPMSSSPVKIITSTLKSNQIRKSIPETP